MADYTVFDIDTGRVVWIGQCSAPSDAAQQADALTMSSRIVFDGRYPDAEWQLIDGEPTARPALVSDTSPSIAADGIEAWSLADVPVGTVVTDLSDGTAYTVDDGTFEFATVEPGTTRLLVAPPFPYQTQTVAVTAHG